VNGKPLRPPSDVDEVIQSIVEGFTRILECFNHLNERISKLEAQMPEKTVILPEELAGERKREFLAEAQRLRRRARKKEGK
jgi:hypothetical protein